MHVFLINVILKRLYRGNLSWCNYNFYHIRYTLTHIRSRKNK